MSSGALKPGSAGIGLRARARVSLAMLAAAAVGGAAAWLAGHSWDRYAGLLVVVGAVTTVAWLDRRRLAQRKAELRALARMAGAIARAHSTDDVLGALVQEASGLAGVARVAAVAGGPDEPVAATSSGGIVVHAGLPARATEPWAGATGEDCSARVVADLAAEGPRELVELLPNTVAAAVAPLVADGRAFGLVAVELTSLRTAARTVDVLTELAVHAALALRSQALVAELERQATVDELTGLMNRRMFDATLEREIARSERYGTPLTVVMLDIDHFKEINDTHGHQVGDAVLREVGRALAGSCRTADVAARYGGEELVVVLPGCQGIQAVFAAERLRHAITHADTPVPVRVSAGIATYPDNGGSAGELVAAADEALYDAKHRGRDRAVRSPRRQPATKRRVATLR